jgi:hypothetical protein
MADSISEHSSAVLPRQPADLKTKIERLWEVSAGKI